jgi:hypothetical protein
LINSRNPLAFSTKTSSSRKGLHPPWRTFSRSYGAILPSSFTQVLSSALVFSTCPPVSVYGTVNVVVKLSHFSWKLGINDFTHSVSQIRSPSGLSLTHRICLARRPTPLDWLYQSPAHLAFSVMTSPTTPVREF